MTHETAASKRFVVTPEMTRFWIGPTRAVAFTPCALNQRQFEPGRGGQGVGAWADTAPAPMPSKQRPRHTVPAQSKKKNE